MGKHSKGKPCPARLRRALASGGEVDYPALAAWWEADCPGWLRELGLSVVAAAVVSVIPEARFRAAPGRIRFTVRPLGD